jgi:hypothetical protein
MKKLEEKQYFLNFSEFLERAYDNGNNVKIILPDGNSITIDNDAIPHLKATCFSTQVEIPPLEKPSEKTKEPQFEYEPLSEDEYIEMKFGQVNARYQYLEYRMEHPFTKRHWKRKKHGERRSDNKGKRNWQKRNWQV